MILLEITLVILPVFLLVFLGFASSFLELLKKQSVDNLAKFCQDFGIPFLLFFNLAILDLNRALDFELLICFYASMILSFILISSISYYIFKQTYNTSIILGFCAMFSNGVLLGLPISELAFGVDSLFTNYTIIIGHAPFCYLVGITLIEIESVQKNSFLTGIKRSLRAILSNNLTIGILLGITVNLSKIQLSTNITELLEIGTIWVIPLSLFTMGGVIFYYRIAKTYKLPSLIIFTSLFIQPSVVYFLGIHFWSINIEYLRNAVLMAAMAPGLNAYFFANMYSECKDTVATTILISTVLTIFSATLWVYFLS
jgi:malonate transporter